MANASLNQFEPAVADYERLLTDPKVHPTLRYQEAVLLLATGRPDEYRSAIQRLLDLFGRNQNIPLIMPVLQASRLADDGVADYDPLIKIAAKLVETNTDKFPFVRTHGHLLYRGRRYREAIERLEEGMKLGKDTHPFLIPDRFFMAMAHHRLGHAEEARQWLGKAEKAMNTLLADPKADEIFKAVGSENNWQNRLVAEVIRNRGRCPDQGGDRSAGPRRGSGAGSRPCPASPVGEGNRRLRPGDRAATRESAPLARACRVPHLASPGRTSQARSGQGR